MPNKDKYHENVKNALRKDGWIITDDPLHLKWGRKDLYVDLGAEKLVIAEKGSQKIAVEIKTFGSHSEVADLQQAIGQYFTYLAVIKRTYPERELYIATHEEIFNDIFAEEPLGQLLLKEYEIPLIIFDPQREVITQWLNCQNTEK